ncbi:MAG: L-arabinose isomerase [Erysipelothrix sp.]|nr:L-arabinose isomerase [Erysipelothrix sp.]
MNNINKKFWFIVGSQHLYGPEALGQVEKNARVIVEELNKANMPYTIEFKDLATTPEKITELMLEANYNEDVAGIITWMHTFSPAKMWIRGTQLLQKPLLHLATQFNESIPWDTIDMDFMNLNQAAHGDREYGYINARLDKRNKIIVGYWDDLEVKEDIAKWMDVAVAYNEGFKIKVARFGDNMRNVAVTDGDKIEAQIQFGWYVDYYGIGDLVEEVNKVTEEEINEVFASFADLYEFDYGNNTEEVWEEHVKVQVAYEIALKRFLEAGNYTAFSTNFQDLHGMDQLPGLAVQRLMAEGYGFAGEGDWKTAALDRFLKIMSHNVATGFMEDYTYELKKGHEAILQSHMLEVDPTFAVNKPRLFVAPLSIGDKGDPARLIFDGMEGEGVAVSVADFGTHFKVLINQISAFTPEQAAPNLPVARVMWRPAPNFKTGVHQWIENGGGHHTVASLALTVDQILDWTSMLDVETVIID